MSILERYANKIKNLVSSIADEEFLRALQLTSRLKTDHGKILLIGNGGSAAICSHLAVDFTKSAGIRAVNFADPSLLTCFANDYGYESAFAEMIDAYGDSGDVLFAISSSGRSENILNAVERATAQGIRTITLSGFDESNPLRSSGFINFYLESHDYNIVENGHEQILLALCDCLRLGETAFRAWINE